MQSDETAHPLGAALWALEGQPKRQIRNDLRPENVKRTIGTYYFLRAFEISLPIRMGDVIHMWYYIHDMQRTVLSFVYQMDTKEWAVFLIVVIGIGAVCMRGYGSWKAY